MPTPPRDSLPPALDLLRGIAAGGADGVSHSALFEDGWPGRTASRLLDALRSRGYVRFDPVSGCWIATRDGVQRVQEAASAPTTPPGGAP